MDYSGSIDLAQILLLMDIDMQMFDPSDKVIIVGAKNPL
jgi:hypothetical protein